MSSACFVEDNGILWLQLPKEGSPAAWQPGYNYQIGDLVIPRNPQPDQLTLMFQCIGYLVDSGTTLPSFPSTPSTGDKFITSTTEYEAQAVTADIPAQLYENEYFIIERTVNVS